MLIVEDDPITRFALESLFKRRGFDVVATSTAEEGYELLQREDAPRLAIIDWVLPGISGLDLCRKLRTLGRSPRTHVIMLTVKIASEDVVAGLDAGADDYVRKPFDVDELYARVRAAERLLSLEDQLRYQVDVDELTGVLSRPAILDTLRRGLTRAARERTQLSIALADVDRFKQINDRYGHTIGDAALRKTAKSLGATLRPYDAIGRYGGEEFLIVLPGCGRDEALEVGERIRQYTERHAMATTLSPLTLTVSLGLATAPAEIPDLNDLIDAADHALYRAKHAGRNRVMVAEAEPQAPWKSRKAMM